MKNYIILIVALFVSSCGCSKEFALVENQRYAVYLKPGSPKLMHFAADELVKYLNMTTGVVCEVKELEHGTENQLIVGRSGSGKLGTCVNTLTPSDADEYLIRIDSDHLVINGNHARGVLYGVYDFLEVFLKCRWYSSKVRSIPFSGTTKIESGDIRYKSPVKWRDVYYYELADPYLAGVHKLNGNAERQMEVSPHRFATRGGYHAGWGYWCHSLYNMVPPSWYDTHPEYFSEVNGKRMPPAGEEGGTQLCLTNADVLHLSVEKLKKEMSKPIINPPVWADSIATYWSVSQMDGNGNCTCKECMRLDQQDGSPSGSILHFVNKVAARFPDKKIATLAYIYSRKAPLYTKPAPNVAIQLCAIETARDGINHPISSSATHALFREDMQEWGKICKNIIVWDYVIQFQNLISPFPNFSVMQDNIQFYVKNNVTGIFCQGNREKGGEFAELRGYLLSKLLWNPNVDVRAIMKDFLDGYYGKAAPFLFEYISLMELELKKSGLKLSMDGEPESHRTGYLSESNWRKYNELFDKAAERVKEEPEVLARVQKERMGLMYVQLRLGYGTVKERKAVLQEFIALAEAHQVWMLSEVDWRKDQSGHREMFENKMNLILNQ